MGNYRNLLFILLGTIAWLLTAFVFQPAPGNPAINHTAGIAILMFIWWITEALPLGLTAIIPFILFPLSGVLSSSRIASSYMNDTIFLFLGGFFIAIAMEKWKLHKRISLAIISLSGNSPVALLRGFMFSGFFLSMWISNTATAIMLLPMAMAMILEYEATFSKENSTAFATALLLGIAYACSAGGIATLVGTPPNLVFQKLHSIIRPDAEPVSFAKWLAIGLPVSILVFLTVYFYLFYLYLRPFKKQKFSLDFINRQKSASGRITTEEKTVLLVFLSTVLLWLFRADIDTGLFVIHGWANLFPVKGFISDGLTVMLTSLALFMIPAENGAILEKADLKSIPWDIILLFGGGFALADAFSSSGLSALFGKSVIGVAKMPFWLLLLSITLAVSFLTEVTSNTATSQTLLPIMASIAMGLGIEAHLLMIPATLSASMAFMLPVATPPNTIVYSSEKLQIKDMIKAGFFLNIIMAIVIVLVTLFYLPLVF